MLAKHEQPAVLSAVMKYETTHRARLVVNDAMDVMGGAGICRGPNNFIGNGYMTIPVAITVEGANILTRSMIIFGQGLNRAHPNLIKIVDSLQKGDDPQGFMKHTMGFMSHFASNAARSLAAAFTPSSRSNLLSYYESQLNKCAANFALCSDMALVLGGRLKFEEMLSGRFADAFGSIYLGYACCWYYQQHKNVKGIDAMFEIAMESLLKQHQTALHELSHNFPIPGIGPMMRGFCYPLGLRYEGPNDRMRKAAAAVITNPTEIRDLITQGIFISKNPQDRSNFMAALLEDAIKAEKIASSCKKEKREMSADEKVFMEGFNAKVNEIVQVDSFEKLGIEKYQDEDYIRPALRGTRFAKVREAVAV